MNHLLSSVEQTQCWYDGASDLFMPIPVKELAAVATEFCSSRSTYRRGYYLGGGVVREQSLLSTNVSGLLC